MYPTLAEILEIPAVAAGRPIVRAGRSALETPVRWVHVSELRDPTGTLSGGELVLSVGLAVSDPATDVEAYLSALRAAGAVALVIEVGQRLRALPSGLVQAARQAAFPLVELRRTVRFVELTEAVHARILTEQYTRLQFAQRVADTFRGLTVDGAAAERVVVEAAALLGLPVALEDAAHRAIALAGGEGATVLRDWIARSRQAPTGPDAADAGPEGWAARPVGRPGDRWGRLVVPVRSGGDDRVPMVLAHACDALTVLDLLDPREPRPLRSAHDRLLADLLAVPSSGAAALETRARALGLPSGPFDVLVLRPAAGPDADLPADLPAALAAAAESAHVPAVAGALPGSAAGAVLAGGGRADLDAVLSAALEAVAGSAPVAAAAAAASFAGLGAGLAEALRVAEVAAGSRDPGARPVWRAADLGALHLLWQLRDDRRLLAYVDGQLGPVLRLGEPRRAELLRSVRAFAEADGVVSTFAARIGTSRAAAYARIRRLSDVLGRDVTDPLAKLSLQVAVLGLAEAGP